MTSFVFKPVEITVTNEEDAPRAHDMYYECRLCRDKVPSQPSDNVGCSCGNIFIDTDYVRLAVEDFSQFSVVKRVQQA